MTIFLLHDEGPEKAIDINFTGGLPLILRLVSLIDYNTKHYRKIDLVKNGCPVYAEVTIDVD